MSDKSAWSDTTLAVGAKDEPRSVELPGMRVPCLTVLHHADPGYVGASHELALQATEISRTAPLFVLPGDATESPLADPHLSRTPCLSLRLQGTLSALEIEALGPTVRVDGQPFDGTKTYPLSALERGIVINLSDRIVLLLHVAERGALPSAGRFKLLGSSDAIRKAHSAIEKVSDLDVPVLIRGESGTGKELTARALHASSQRSSGPFVAVNMGAISVSTAASELFGHRKGAFTGATSDRRGLFAQANGGTLFLDEIGETPPEIQVMLLRCLEDGLIQPVGSDTTEQVDVRILAATDRNLESAVEEGSFRGPLFYRLAGFQIPLPALRSRIEDLGILLHAFLRRELEKLGETGRPLKRPIRDELWLRAEVVEKLALSEWPGNIRQLSNIAQQLVISSRGADSPSLPDSLFRLLLSPEQRVDASDDPEISSPSSDRKTRLRPEDIDEPMLLEALRTEGWKVAATARRLGISRTSLYALMEKSTRIKKARDLSERDIDGDGIWSGVDLLEWNSPEPAQMMTSKVKIKADWSHEIEWLN